MIPFQDMKNQPDPSLVISFKYFIISSHFSSHVVFGHVVEGERYLDQIEMTAVDTDHKPFADIRIVDCGLVPGYEEEKAAQPVPDQTPITVPMPPVAAAPVAVPPVAAG